MAESSYKRTVAGSVGAGVGALFNASGRTYYILEHKTTSKYHNAGESQKIIIDQIELGRDSSCQVRYDESFETVSRKHAAIVRDGENWQLVNLSTSNPTLVNGQPIQGSYYLQSGDEIQLSVGGPRLGFIVPQGKQALTSSIRLTERMNLFRQQALAPYRRALWILATLLILVILGFGAWNFYLHKQNAELREQQKAAIETVANLDSQIGDLEAQIAEAEKNAAAAKEQAARRGGSTVIYRNNDSNNSVLSELRQRLQDLQQQRAEAANNLMNINSQLGETGDDSPGFIEGVNDNPNIIQGQNPENKREGEKPTGASDARSYYGSIFRIIVDDITIEDRDGVSHRSNISTNKVDCGSGFITPSSTFVTARQNIQPWIYVDGNTPASDWRRRLAAVFALGNDIIISYSAYSTDGTAKKLMFSSRDFDMPSGGDIVTTHIEITDEDIIYFETIGLTFDKKRLLKEGLDIVHATASARAWAALPGTDRVGIPTDAGASNSIAGGQPLDIVYYDTNDPRALGTAAAYYTANTERTDNRAGTIRLQSGPGHAAFGAPVFLRESDNALMVVGMYVGNNRVVPIHSLP